MTQSPWINIDADRYPDFWAKLSETCKKLVGHRCCYPGCMASLSNGDNLETHHVITGEKDESGVWQPVKLYIPGLMLVPLCEKHHAIRTHPECAHHPDNWHPGTRENQFRDARNTEEYHLILVQGWYEKLLPRYRSKVNHVENQTNC